MKAVANDWRAKIVLLAMANVAALASVVALLVWSVPRV
jgi:hypothetical protein